MTFLRFFNLVSILLMCSSFSSLDLKSCSIKYFCQWIHKPFIAYLYTTESKQRICAMRHFLRLRIFSLSLILTILIATFVSVILYPENMGPKGITSFSWTVALLILYSIFCFSLPVLSNNDFIYVALKQGTILGYITGAIWMIHLTTEHFINLPGKLNGITTLVFMFLNFVLFGTTSYRTLKRTGKLGISLLSSIWCAMFSILLLIIYAIVLIILFTKRFETNLYFEFTKSGMKEIKSFVINNTLESASTHLFEAPVIAVIFGLIIIGLMKTKNLLIKGTN